MVTIQTFLEHFVWTFIFFFLLFYSEIVLAECKDYHMILLVEIGENALSQKQKQQDKNWKSTRQE